MISSYPPSQTGDIFPRDERARIQRYPATEMLEQLEVASNHKGRLVESGGSELS